MGQVIDPAKAEPTRPSIDTALIYAGVAALYLAARLLILARGDVAVALELARHTSPSSLFVASLVSSLPLVLGMGVVLWMHRRRQHAHWERAVVSLVMALAVFTFPFWALMVLIPVVVFTYAPRLRKTAPSRALRWPFTGQEPGEGMAALASWVLTVGFVSAPMYVPLEQVTLKGQPTTVAWVLGTEGGYTSLLVEAGRRVIRVKEAEVTARVLCREHLSWWERSVLTLNSDRPAHDTCED